MTTATGVHDTLRRLGDTPEAIAETLRVKGVRGSTRSVDRCPIAVWLSQEYPEVDWIQVGRGMAIVQGVATVFLPAAVREFVDAFDLGAHPDLEAGAL